VSRSAHGDARSAASVRGIRGPHGCAMGSRIAAPRGTLGAADGAHTPVAASSLKYIRFRAAGHARSGFTAHRRE